MRFTLSQISSLVLQKKNCISSKILRSARYDDKFWNRTLPGVDFTKRDEVIESWQKWRNAEFNDCIRRLMRPKECFSQNDETLVKFP